MGKSSGGKATISDYYISLHLGICASGEGLKLLNVKMGEKTVWEGALEHNANRYIDKPDLFGGPKKEGGVRGVMWWFNGNPKQRMPGPIAERMGRTYETCPGIRGLASFYLTAFDRRPEEEEEQETPYGGMFVNTAALLRATLFSIKGFLVSSNTPYLKAISAKVRRPSIGLDPSIAMIQIPDDSTGKEQYTSNPAHMVFEAMTNIEWGMGAPYSDFDIGSFEDCAQTLFDEGFGLSLKWMRQSAIQDFIEEVLDHIQGAVGISPATGKHTMVLLRGDYDPDTLPVIDPDNASMSNFVRKAWGEISNEVVVTYTNAETEKEETVTVQDLGAIAAQGGVSSTTRKYIGIRTQELAMRVAERDLAAVVYPIITCDVEVTRDLWKAAVFGVVTLHWPERAVEAVSMRISKVTKGASSRTVKLSLYEDVFGLDTASYLDTIETGWQDTSVAPSPAQNYYLGTAPAFLTAAQTDLDDPGDIPYPEATALLAVAPNTVDNVAYDLAAHTSDVSGESQITTYPDRALNGSWVLTEAMMRENRSDVIIKGYGGQEPGRGDFVLMGQDDASSEVCVIRNISGATATLERGLLDTTPKEWPIGTRLYVIAADSDAADPARRTAGELARYHILMQTSKGELALADAPEISTSISLRPHRPLRPAAIKVGNNRYTPYNMGSDPSVPLTWSIRNRTEESSQVMLWIDPGVTPEAGQTTSFELLDPSDRSVIVRVDDIEGESYELLRDTFAGYSQVIVKIFSVRGSLESLQSHEVVLNAS